jgi:hypothetical protein
MHSFKSRSPTGANAKTVNSAAGTPPVEYRDGDSKDIRPREPLKRLRRHGAGIDKIIAETLQKEPTG